MIKIDKNDLIFLEQLYTPKILLWVYWVSIIITVIGAGNSMFAEGFTFAAFIRGLFIMTFGLFFLRVFMEVVLILFKIEKHLSKLSSANSTASSNKERPQEGA